jgi:hypothetical protein
VLVKMVEQWTSKHNIEGSTFTSFFEFFFFHSHIHNALYSIHKVFPTVVEACFLYCSIAQSKGTPMCNAIPGFEPMPLLCPTVEIKLCMVYS